MKKEIFYIGKDIKTNEEVLVSKNDYDELGDKAEESLKDMGITVDTKRTMSKVISDFDLYDCWDAVGGDWEG